MTRTPAQWLDLLTQRMDKDAPRYRRLESYVNGDAPLPELSKDTSEAWKAFQEEARTNFGATVRDAVADRIVPIGITVGGSVTSPSAKAAQLVWRNNRMDHVVRQLVEYGLTYGKSYLTAWLNEGDDVPVVVAASPLKVCADVDPLQPWRVNAAVRVWRNPSEELDYARVISDGETQLFTRPSRTTTARGDSTVVLNRFAGEWRAETDVEPFFGEIPVVVYDNPTGMAEVEAHTDIIDRINRSVLNLLTTNAMQAFKQRALVKPAGADDLPTHDDNGNVIDWGKLFEPAPAALWNLPVGVSVWEGAATDTSPMLNSITNFVKHLSAATCTPLPMLMPDSANQSAAGAENTEKSFIFKVRQRLALAKLATEAILVIAVDSMGKPTSKTFDVRFEDPTRVLLTEKFNAAVQAKAAGLSLRTIQTLILGMTPEEIEEDAAEREKEKASAPTPPPPPAAPAPDEEPEAPEVRDPKETGPTADKRLTSKA